MSRPKRTTEKRNRSAEPRHGTQAARAAPLEAAPQSDGTGGAGRALGASFVSRSFDFAPCARRAHVFRAFDFAPCAAFAQID
eukprot:2489442-Rhodomonas_salina.1